MALRDSWIEKREAAAASANGNRNMSQMHLARKGVLTEEMQFAGKREKLDPEVLREEIARGRAIVPAMRPTVNSVWARQSRGGISSREPPPAAQACWLPPGCQVVARKSLQQRLRPRIALVITRRA